MRRTVLVALVLLGVVGSVRAAAMPSPPLLALTGGELGNRSRLLALEPRTLEARGSLALPSWAFGREWARSPDGDQLALVPKPSETDERLFVVAVRGSLRVLARMPLRGADVCRLAWPSARRLLVVLTRGAACYDAIDSARLLVIDPVSLRVVGRYAVSGPTTIVATAPTSDGLALLLAVPGRRSGARLVLVAATATRTIRLPRMRVLPRPLDKSLLGSAIGLAVDRKSGRAYVVESDERVTEVHLARGRVGVHAVRLRKPAAAAKGLGGSMVQALSLRSGLLAITGIRRVPGGRPRPLGLRILDTRDWRARLLEPEATGIAVEGTTLLAFQPLFDQLDKGVTAIGLRGYTLEGLIRFRVLSGRPIVDARTQSSYAYAAGPGPAGVSVIDLSDGRIETPGPNATAISAFELLAGPTP